MAAHGWPGHLFGVGKSTDPDPGIALDLAQHQGVESRYAGALGLLSQASRDAQQRGPESVGQDDGV
ncbi:hypothetical protein ASE02_10980 [Phenylobacterium sp. Root700]|nr:hypothetical protein ASE02_10980 [Phenylobacterium sp. Root700]